MTLAPPAERTFLEEGDIKITDARAIFGSKTYALKNITSVELQKHAASGFVPITLVVSGSLPLIYGIGTLGDGGWSWLLAGLILIGLGVLVMRSQKPSYIVKVSGSSGETNALTSTDRAHIQRIVTAINDAIVSR